MLTGELPGKTIEPPSKKVQIDVRLDEMVLRALEQKPELRYQQVSEVKTMVETIVGDPKKSEVGSRKPESESPRDWRIWSPFQSPEVREICAHLTEAERNVLMRRGGQFGIWINVIPVLVMMAGIQFHNKGIMLALAGVLILFYAASIFAVQWLNRRFLCSTDWARREGIKPESLRLFSFGKTPPGSSRRQPRQSEATAGEEDQTEKSESGKPAATTRCRFLISGKRWKWGIMVAPGTRPPRISNATRAATNGWPGWKRNVALWAGRWIENLFPQPSSPR